VECEDPQRIFNSFTRVDMEFDVA